MAEKKLSPTARNIVLAAVIVMFILAWQMYAPSAIVPIGPQPTALAQMETSPVNETTMSKVGIPETVASQIVEYPGYRLSFNPGMHQPNWVAWELTADECRAQEVNRKSAAFATDYEVEGCADVADYKNSGMTRGHMCPAGDMKWSNESMQACFMLTNICPQAEALNNGAWRVLEEKCRAWALRDSAIVIVCGPILSDSLPRSIGEKEIPVPERFFKVVCAPYSTPPRAIGFIMSNGNVAGGIQNAAVSVDEVEEITGFDFFAAMPDDIENEMESKCNFPQWSTR